MPIDVACAAYAATDPQWADFHRLRGSGEVCFWMPKPRRPKRLLPSRRSRWYFTRRGFQQIEGYGIYSRYDIRKVSNLWEKYREKTGADTEEELVRLINTATSGRNEIDPSTDIGCVWLTNVRFFDHPVSLT